MKGVMVPESCGNVDLLPHHLLEVTLLVTTIQKIRHKVTLCQDQAVNRGQDRMIVERSKIMPQTIVRAIYRRVLNSILWMDTTSLAQKS